MVNETERRVLRVLEHIHATAPAALRSHSGSEVGRGLTIAAPLEEVMLPAGRPCRADLHRPLRRSAGRP
jgi:hypothetical protein